MNYQRIVTTLIKRVRQAERERAEHWDEIRELQDRLRLDPDNELEKALDDAIEKINELEKFIQNNC